MTTEELEQKANEEAKKHFGCYQCAFRCTMIGFELHPWDVNECEPGLFIEGYMRGYQDALETPVETPTNFDPYNTSIKSTRKRFDPDNTGIKSEQGVLTPKIQATNHPTTNRPL